MKFHLDRIIQLSKISWVFVALMGLPAPANAIDFTGESAGEWGAPLIPNPTSVFSITSQDGGTNNRLTWGIPSPGNLTSYVQFDGGNFITGTDSLFKIGELSYRNGSTYVYSNFDGDFPLNLNLSLTLPFRNNETFNFLFDILNRPNTTGDPVLDGDILRFATAGVSDHKFNYQGTNYTLQLIGFSTDEGQTILNEFNSPERSTTKASLYGTIVAANTVSVPEPVSVISFLILGVCLAWWKLS